MECSIHRWRVTAVVLSNNSFHSQLTGSQDYLDGFVSLFFFSRTKLQQHVLEVKEICCVVLKAEIWMFFFFTISPLFFHTTCMFNASSEHGTQTRHTEVHLTSSVRVTNTFSIVSESLQKKRHKKTFSMQWRPCESSLFINMYIFECDHLDASLEVEETGWDYIADSRARHHHTHLTRQLPSSFYVSHR